MSPWSYADKEGGLLSPKSSLSESLFPMLGAAGHRPRACLACMMHDIGLPLIVARKLVRQLWALLTIGLDQV